MEEILIQYGAMGAVLIWFMYRFEGRISKLEDKIDKLDDILDKLANVLSVYLGKPTQDLGAGVPVVQFTKKAGL